MEEATNTTSDSKDELEHQLANTIEVGKVLEKEIVELLDGDPCTTTSHVTTTNGKSHNEPSQRQQLL